MGDPAHALNTARSSFTELELYIALINIITPSATSHGRRSKCNELQH